ncbi:MAG: TraR/DksA C4-type zinc finger protein [Candidatus Yonathbacteria bacterium]|nr:TraR/DksA C4-type zinc finger protein [Candidatus Yonathbacteria bacterium]
MTKNTSIDTNHFKEKLETEKKLVEGELKSVGRVNPENPKDWEATPSSIDVMSADKTEVAEQMEEFEERSSVEVELENKLRSITRALDKIKRGTYGICEKGGEPIEKERLEANPAATTCIKHLNG